MVADDVPAAYIIQLILQARALGFTVIATPGAAKGEYVTYTFSPPQSS